MSLKNASTKTRLKIFMSLLMKISGTLQLSRNADQSATLGDSASLRRPPGLHLHGANRVGVWETQHIVSDISPAFELVFGCLVG